MNGRGEVKQKPRPIPPPPPAPVEEPDDIEEKPVIKITEKKQSTTPNNRCLWRNTSPANTTFEVRCHCVSLNS